MTVDGINSSLNSMISIRQPDGERDQPAGSGTLDLAKLTDSISLSSIDPKLRSVLEEISERGGNVVDALEGNINTLQDGFLETLHTRLSEAGVSLDEKITLRHGEGASLTLIGQHPDKESIEGVLANSPDLTEAFDEITGQSELVRDIRNIRKVVKSRSAMAQYAEAAAEGDKGNDTYQLSMRGAFSHFYFTKE
ncbi:hypothetical protein N1030_05330 [Desulfovibrio mangrovi]|uniref:hypothetical protein n=1 Tax=Desulfovibrio mangrovi TaxID=2976983 RepID=UPI002245A1AA|nr:hypothetical protein [Desulfovibrio mangrovi]UZP68398.1 hypothetical protein N1030_05330 [Desulfovibrio mangrovi]